MTVNLKNKTPKTTLPPAGVLFGADSTSAASPDIYTPEAIFSSLFFQNIGAGAVATALESWLRLLAVRVTDYGGVCDGNADDSAAFALAYATGKPIYIPAGQTVSLDAASFTSGCVIFGDGDASVIKWRNTTGSDDLFMFDTNVMQCVFRDVKFDCNRTAHTDTAEYFGAISFRGLGGSRFVLKNVWFDKGRIIDVQVVGPTTGTDLIYFEMEGCRFTDGLVGDITRSAQCVAITDGVDVTLLNNQASLPSRPATYGRAGFVHDGARNGTALRGKYTAIGNRFKNMGRGTADTLGCVDVYYGADEITMIGNRGTDICGRFVSTKGDQSRIVKIGNVVNDVFSSVANAASAFSHFQDLFDAVVDTQYTHQGNVCGTSSGYGVFFDGASPSGASNFKDLLIDGFQCGAAGVAAIHVRSAGAVTIANPIVRGGLNAITFSAITGLLAIRGGSLSDTTSHAIDGNAAIGVNDNCDFVLDGTAIYNAGANAIILTKLKSYRINPAIVDGCTNAITTNGSDQASDVRGKFANMSTGLWVKSGTDAAVRYHDKDIVSSTALSFGNRNRTIASGVLSVYADWHYVATEGGAGTDDLDTINGGREGYMLTLRAASSSNDVVLIDGSGNLRLNGSFTLDNAQDSITLLFSGGEWVEIARSDNAA
jgi:hypothetical protein